ncbi:transcriptional regulator [Streptomyces noursei]|uniref:Transcriptional regulator n=1 Tax=Streptomyces noursei TaxID=1971 RepID=A0A2N8PR02_STRNR|nr:transcriptional regulator [Streptomyces noursei]PNE43464.1 transcriptional regulator [Streptomyces noursei]
MGRPALNRQPNALLTHWLDRSGLSNVGLARAVAQLARARGHRQVTPDESRVRRWLAGETPREPLPELIASVLAERVGLPLTGPDLGFASSRVIRVDRPDLPWNAAGTVEAIAHLTRSELMLPHTRNGEDAAHIHHGEQLLTPLAHWTSAKGTVTGQPYTETRGRHIGMTEVEGLQELTRMFRDSDNRLGGMLSRKAVVAQMADATAMLDACAYTESVGRRLFAAVADLGSVAAWMSFDSGLHTSAQQLFVTALHAASEGRDPVLGAHILQCMARQMSHLGHIDDALDLVHLAQYGARRQASPSTLSMLAALEARFHALLGFSDESERAAGRAEEAFTRINPAEEPPHMAFFDRAELCATLGVAHQIAAKSDTTVRRAQRAEKSVRLLTEALDLRPDNRVRSMAFDRLGLARTHLVVGELAGAREETAAAVQLFGAVTSTRVADRLIELHDEAEPFAATHEAADLREQIQHAVSSPSKPQPHWA